LQRHKRLGRLSPEAPGWRTCTPPSTCLLR
jgi:hypothetical protein